MTEWEHIAESWNQYRGKPSKYIEKLASEWTTGKILDIGCANGRNLMLFSQDKYGIDSAKNMIEIARKKTSATYFVGDAQKLPFSDNMFDYVLFTRTLHLVEDREKALLEMKRVMKPGALAVVEVWNKWQKRFIFGPKLATVPWKYQGKVYDRKYYLYNYFELRRQLKKHFKIKNAKGMFEPALIFIVQKNAL